MAYNDRTEGPPNRVLNLTLRVLGASELSCLLIVIMRLGGSAEENSSVVLDTQPLPIPHAAANRLGEVERVSRRKYARRKEKKPLKEPHGGYRLLQDITRFTSIARPVNPGRGGSRDKKIRHRGDPQASWPRLLLACFVGEMRRQKRWPADRYAIENRSRRMGRNCCISTAVR